MPTRPAARLLAAALCAAPLAGCGGGGGGPAPAPVPAPAPAGVGDGGAFLVRLGNDTLAGERFTRTASTLTAEGVVRSPAVILRSYSAALRPDGSVARFELSARRAAGTVPPQRVTMIFTGNAVEVATQVGDSTPRTSSVPVAGTAIPYVGNSFALMELATRAARAAGAGADSVPLSLVATIGRVLPATVTPLGADSMLVSIAGDAPYRVRVDADGRILGLQGTPTQRVDVARLPALDVSALSAERPIGTLSPTDTVEGAIGRARIGVVYSRPARRGRTILGGVVPYDSVWRTGANAATVFTTSAPLNVGGLDVPRGSYTLWTRPSRGGRWQLIINRETGQWGTEYDPKRDLGRVDLVVARPPAPVEQFTISILPGDGTMGRLQLAWDDFQASVPIAVRRE